MRKNDTDTANPRGRGILRRIPLFAFLPFLFASCISIEEELTGELDTPYTIGGVSMLMDDAVDKHVALALRNDSDENRKVMIRPVGGDIGYDSSAGAGSVGFAYGDRGVVKAAYLLSQSDIEMTPGDEFLIDIFLNNWHYATRDFVSKVRVDVIDTAGERRRLVFPVDQSDIFTDPQAMFADNKFGRNDPDSFAAIHAGADGLPGDFTIIIPVTPQ